MVPNRCMLTYSQDTDLMWACHHIKSNALDQTHLVRLLPMKWLSLIKVLLVVNSGESKTWIWKLKFFCIFLYIKLICCSSKDGHTVEWQSWRHHIFRDNKRDILSLLHIKYKIVEANSLMRNNAGAIILTKNTNSGFNTRYYFIHHYASKRS